VLEHVKGIGEEHKLQMLPVLKKPFETSTIIAIVRQLKLGHPAPVAARVRLDDALGKGWIEFWCQPKIDLRKKQLAVVELFARCRHPRSGILSPNAFMPGATDAELLAISELALVNALTIGNNFSTLGINLRFAVNIPVSALAKLAIPEIVRSHRVQIDHWLVHRYHRRADRDRSSACRRDGEETRSSQRQASDRRFRPRLFIAGALEGASLRRAQARPNLRY